MSSIISSVFKGNATTLGQGLGEGTQGPLEMIANAQAKLGANAASCLDAGSKVCPIVKEGRGLGEGITGGDLNQTATNAGMLAMYSLAGQFASNASVKVGLKGASKGMLAT